MTAEVRARTLTGRHQISDDGRHLVDGVPFGRPYLRHPSRPAITIPPRKRARLDDTTDEPVEVMGLLTANGEEAEQRLHRLPSQPRGVSRRDRSNKHPKTVHFSQLEIDQADDEDEDEDDSDFAPEGDDRKAVSKLDSEGDGLMASSGASSEGSSSPRGTSDSDLDSSSNYDSDSGSDSKSKSDSGSGSDSDSDPVSNSGSSSNSDSSSDDESDSSSDESSLPDVMSSKHSSTLQNQSMAMENSSNHTPPGHGSSATRSRNARRVKVNRLRHLKAMGQIHQNANLSDLQNFEDAQQSSQIYIQEPSKPWSASLGKRKRLDKDESVDGTAEEETELARKKRELMAKLETQSASSKTLPDEPSQSQRSSIVPNGTASEPSEKQEQLVDAKTPSRRLRPDTTAISRILARQALPVAKKAKTKPATETPAEPEGVTDPDFWKSKINLSAFECWEEDFELTAPPFPFQQHWDPTSKLMRDKANKKKHKREAKPRDPVSEMEDDKENILLDYDDAPATANPESEVRASIENEPRPNAETAVLASPPSLPADLGTLPELAPLDIKAGAIIVCKLFTVNPVTVTPEISDVKILTVAQEGDSGNGAGTIRLKVLGQDLARRKKKYDSKGNRLYESRDKFFMSDDEDAEADTDLWEGTFSELLEAKLLKAA